MTTPSELVKQALDEAAGFGTGDWADRALAALREGGYTVALRNPCRCGCEKPRDQHLCPCGCGHPYEDAVRKVMGGPMYLNWDQASANIDEHPDVPCKWPA